MPIDRQPLLDQVVVTLLDEIAQGAYPRRLPSERDLAKLLKVSRPVVRSALQVLERQGWIQTQGQSKSRQVIKRPAEDQNLRKTRRVGVLTSKPLDELSADDYNMVNWISDQCREAGWQSVIHPMDQLDARNLERRLEEIIETPPCDIWIGLPMHNYLCLSLLHQRGQKVIGIAIPDKGAGYGVIHYDNRSALAHALGVMLRAGRKHVVIPFSRRRPAELVTRFSKLLEEYGIRYREDFHCPLYDGTREGFIRLLDLQFAARPRPDGIVLVYTTQVQVVLLEGWMMKNRLSYPEDLSVIQVGSDTFLDMMYLPVTHYTSLPGPLAEAAFNAIRHYFATGELLTGRLKLDVEYVKGESV